MPTNEVILESEAEAAAKRLPIQTRLSREASIIPLVTEARRQMELYEYQLLINAVALNPQDAVEQIRRQINATNDMGKVASLQKKAAEISQMSEEVKHKAKGVCLGHFIEHVKPALVELVNGALVVLEDYSIEAQTAEELLFAQFAMGHEATGVSRRVRAAIATVKGFRDGLTENVASAQVTPPPPRHPALQWFC